MYIIYLLSSPQVSTTKHAFLALQAILLHPLLSQSQVVWSQCPRFTSFLLDVFCYHLSSSNPMMIERHTEFNNFGYEDLPQTTYDRSEIIFDRLFEEISIKLFISIFD